jgi:hypothetical protein
MAWWLLVVVADLPQVRQLMQYSDVGSFSATVLVCLQHLRQAGIVRNYATAKQPTNLICN